MNVWSFGRTLRKVNATFEMLSLGVDDEKGISGLLWPVLVFSMYESCDPNTTMFPSSTVALTEANGLLTSAKKNFMLHF